MVPPTKKKTRMFPIDVPFLVDLALGKCQKITQKSAPRSPSFLHGGAARAPEPGAEIFRTVATAAMGHAVDLADLLPVQGGDQDEDEAGDEEGDACRTSVQRRREKGLNSWI